VVILSVWGGDGRWVLEEKDQFGAYVGARNVLYPSEGGTLRLASLNYQGIAKGNTIKMTSFAGGWVDDDTGVVVAENDTPDTKECTLYDDNIMQCTTFLTEYCGPDNVTSVFDIPCTAGEWLMTYTL
jgi:hypothetical protein